MTTTLSLLFGEGGEGGKEGGGGGGSSTYLALWKLFVTIFSDICPFKGEEEGEGVLSLKQIFGLSLVAYADETFRLSSLLRKRVCLSNAYLNNF